MLIELVVLCSRNESGRPRRVTVDHSYFLHEVVVQCETVVEFLSRASMYVHIYIILVEYLLKTAQVTLSLATVTKTGCV